MTRKPHKWKLSKLILQPSRTLKRFLGHSPYRLKYENFLYITHENVSLHKKQTKDTTYTKSLNIATGTYMSTNRVTLDYKNIHIKNTHIKLLIQIKMWEKGLLGHLATW